VTPLRQLSQRVLLLLLHRLHGVADRNQQPIIELIIIGQ
jgi:hypothetical protein